MDAANDRIRIEYDWEALRGLSLTGDVEQLIESYPYSSVSNPTALPFAQTALSQALIVCALERHWLTHGNYPESLSQLFPAYLKHIPSDVVSGRAMIYERTDAGRYQLRGVGHNGKDNRKDKSSDDWLWAYPTNAVPSIVLPLK